MSTVTIRIDPQLKLRMARLAKASGRSQNSLMVEALEQMADELDAKHAFTLLAVARDQALRAGQAPVEWHDMKSWMNAEMERRSAAIKSVR